MLSRRNFIRVVGTGGAVMALGAGGWWAGTRGAMPDSAVAPWGGPAAGLRDPRLRAASHALLAPNAHNRQAWLLRLVGADEAVLQVDLDRLLPETDPPGRQILISQGTFLELFRMAAAAEGYRTEITLLPEGAFEADRLDARPVAHLRLVRDGAVPADPLFAWTGKRRSNRDPYDTARPVDPARLVRLTDAMPAGVRLVTADEPVLRQRLRDLMEAAMRLEIETPHTFGESIDLMRIGPAEVAADPDGISLLGPMMWWGSRLGFVSREDLRTPGSASFQVGLDMARDQAQTAMAHGWIVTPDNNRESQLRAGFAFVRLGLKAAEQGMAMQPMSQLLQEYPEMTDLQRQFLETVGVTAPAHVQMLVRFGHAADPGPSPRRPLDAIMVA